MQYAKADSAEQLYANYIFKFIVISNFDNHTRYGEYIGIKDCRNSENDISVLWNLTEHKLNNPLIQYKEINYLFKGY